MQRKTLSWQTTLAVSGLLLAFSTQAHEIEKHMKDAEKPDCAAMKTIDPAKMDPNDPVTQAIMQRCMSELHQDELTPDSSHDSHSGENGKAEAKHPSKHQH
jgi:hypothetical protein